MKGGWVWGIVVGQQFSAIIIFYSKQMSSSEDCTCHQCQQNYHEPTRTHNNIYSNRRHDIRHHQAKRRFPPTKKDLFPKDISLKTKFYKKYHPSNLPNLALFSDIKNQYKNNAATPAKYKLNDPNLHKANSITSSGVQTIYHAVGQSQREKLMKCSPNPISMQNEVELVNRNMPLTDRERRNNEGVKAVNMERKKEISQLDENFLKNFIHNEKKEEQVCQASASEENSEI